MIGSGQPNEVSLRGFEPKSPAMQKVYSEVSDYAHHGLSCIIFGPRGSGKEFLVKHYVQKFRERSRRGHLAPFERLNCVGITETLAQSELFGHVKGAFTGASQDKEGLFEVANGGVLFLDEVGDLTPYLQAQLLRAISPGEARKVGSTETYRTDKVTVICATEKSKEKLRPALLDRFGAQVFVPGLDARAEDITSAIEFFARRALAKRRDIGDIIGRFFDEDESEMVMQEAKVLKIANEIQKRIEGLVRERLWPGNLRALRVAIDTAIFRAKFSNGQEAFLKDVVHFFVEHRDNYSAPAISSKAGTVAASSPVNGEIETQRVLDKKLIDDLAVMSPGMDAPVRFSLAAFLQNTEGRIFTRRDLEREFPDISPRTAQSWLEKLRRAKTITQHGPRGEHYRLALALGTQRSEKPERPAFLPLPPDVTWPHGVRKDLDAIHDLLEHSRALFISGEKGVGKTVCAQALGMELSTKRPVYYYSFGDRGLPFFLELLDNEMKKRNITDESIYKAEDPNNLALQAAAMSSNVKNLFNTEEHPVLILDNVQLLTDPDQEKTLLAMVQYWKGVSFVLVGERLGNEFQKYLKDRIVEYNIVRQIESSGPPEENVAEKKIDLEG